MIATVNSLREATGPVFPTPFTVSITLTICAHGMPSSKSTKMVFEGELAACNVARSAVASWVRCTISDALEPSRISTVPSSMPRTTNGGSVGIGNSGASSGTSTVMFRIMTGIVTMKMTSKTRTTSTKGVTLRALFAPLPEPCDDIPISCEYHRMPQVLLQGTYPPVTAPIRRIRSAGNTSARRRPLYSRSMPHLLLLPTRRRRSLLR